SDPAMGVCLRPPFLQGGQLGLSAHQGGVPFTRDRGPHLAANPRGRRKVFIEDRLVELRGLVQRGHTEFPVENGHKRPVSLDGSGSITSPCLEEHEKPMRRFMELVEIYPAMVGGDSCPVI